jgi:tetratricopeptide (TPR) repeat protein
MLERALVLDPRFAAARAMYGMTFVLSIYQGYSNDIELLYRGEREIRKALDLAPEYATARVGLGAAYLHLNRAQLARVEFERALALDPANFPATAWLGIDAHRAGDHARAEALSRACLKQAPLFFGARYLLADVLFEQGRSEEARREIEKIYEQDADNVAAHCSSVRLSLANGDVARARADLDHMLKLEAARSNFRLRLAEALLLAHEHRDDEARGRLDASLAKYAEIAPFAAAQMAEVYSAVGRTDDALDWLDRAVRSGDERVDWFRRNPFLAGVRDKPRFGEILRAVEARRK